MRTRIRPRRPSPAMVVAALALAVALGGTAEATVIITSNADVGPSTISGSVPPAGDTANIIAGSIGQSDIHAGAIPAKKLAAGVLGARAWGYVDSIGTLDTARSKNIAAVTRPATGEYCVQLPSSMPISNVTFVVSPDYALDDTSHIQRAGVEGATQAVGSLRCTGNALLVIGYTETVDSTGMHITLSDEPFFIVVG
jgi:hypothetical protein